MTVRGAWLLLAACLAWISGSCASVRDPNLVAVVGGAIIDPATSAPPQIATILISGHRILAVGEAVRVPRSARVIEARGKFITPGLWDMHGHLLTGPPLGAKLEGYVGHGVLGVRDMGGLPEHLFALRREVGAGRLGPELVLAGPTLNGEKFAEWHRVVATSEAARAAVRELKAQGADVIKTHRATKRDVFFALSDEARRQQIPLAGHVPLTVTWIEAVEAGVSSIEHIQTIVENPIGDPNASAANILGQMTAVQGVAGDQIFAAMARRGVYLDPTLITYERSIATAAPDLAARRRILYNVIKPLVGRAEAAGVPIVTGTDMLTTPGAYLIDEVRLLTEGGLTPRQALRAATSRAATAAGRPELGSVRAGGPASFLIFDQDPTKDARNLRSLSTVVLRGRIIESEELARLRAQDQ